ncbi:hypothetical protein [Propionigenium maris]|uniref:hypothetical protein n=1 Tax=Propionigenium maris TaxID=45622 RepID=UPI002492BCD1|nr:hypothetical protein [Propionigenium maris]
MLIMSMVGRKKGVIIYGIRRKGRKKSLPGRGCCEESKKKGNILLLNIRKR